MTEDVRISAKMVQDARKAAFQYCGGKKEIDLGMVKAIIKSAFGAGESQIAKALKPFADAVYNDNGDVMIVTQQITTEDFLKAHNTYRAWKRK